MGDAIPPVPVLIATATTERRPRRESRGRRSADQESAGSPVADARPERRRANAPFEPPRFPASLFEASLFGQRIRSVATALRLVRRAEWTPPESDLRLKDKSV